MRVNNLPRVVIWQCSAPGGSQTSDITRSLDYQSHT